MILTVHPSGHKIFVTFSISIQTLALTHTVCEYFLHIQDSNCQSCEIQITVLGNIQLDSKRMVNNLPWKIKLFGEGDMDSGIRGEEKVTPYFYRACK